MSKVTLETIVSLCKRRGFVFPSAEIYSGLNGVYDFGPLGALVKQNIKNFWLKHVDSFPEEVVQLDGAILGAESTWEASGHVDNFSDPMVDCTNCKKRFRSDDGSIDLEKACPNCGVKAWTEPRQFNLMFQAELGAMSGTGAVVYLRPETAQSIFINFKNVTSSSRVKIPFGIAQTGKAFRNEITPKQFLFRVREFEQMEIEFFCKPEQSDEYFTVWLERQQELYKKLGLSQEKLRIRPHDPDELAHYSKCCSDVEFEFPFGWKELEGIAHRSDFDLRQHSEHSGKDLGVFDQTENRSYIPHVVECSVGVDRLFFAIMCDAYTEEEIEGEKRVVLKLNKQIAPIKAAIMPLVKKIGEPAKKLADLFKQADIKVQYDESGSIGKRYRRQDEIGTPYCITVDFDSLEDNCVTVRDRDTLQQERIPMDRVIEYVAAGLKT